MLQTTQKRIVLAGRVFVPVGESTVAHDIEVMRLLKVAGLDDPRLRTGESPEAFGWRVLQALIETKALLPLVACLIVPESAAPRRRGFLRAWLEDLGIVREAARAEGWTNALQAETAAFLGALDEPADKQLVYQVVAELLFPFLKTGLASWAASPSSSGTSAGPVEVMSPPAVNGAPISATGAS